MSSYTRAICIEQRITVNKSMDELIEYLHSPGFRIAHSGLKSRNLVSSKIRYNTIKTESLTDSNSNSNNQFKRKIFVMSKDHNTTSNTKNTKINVALNNQERTEIFCSCVIIPNDRIRKTMKRNQKSNSKDVLQLTNDESDNKEIILDDNSVTNLNTKIKEIKEKCFIDAMISIITPVPNKFYGRIIGKINMFTSMKNADVFEMVIRRNMRVINLSPDKLNMNLFYNNSTEMSILNSWNSLTSNSSNSTKRKDLEDHQINSVILIVWDKRGIEITLERTINDQNKYRNLLSNLLNNYGNNNEESLVTIRGIESYTDDLETGDYYMRIRFYHQISINEKGIREISLFEIKGAAFQEIYDRIFELV